MIVVDSAPLIYLSKTGRLELLRRVYGTIVVPAGVWEEVVTQAQGRPGSSEVEKGQQQGWIKVEKVSVPGILKVEGAEGVGGEVISLGERRNFPILTNDSLLVAIARTRGVKVKWLTQAIIEAVDGKVLTTREGRVLLRDLVRSGLRIRSEVLAEVVHMMERPSDR